MFGYMSGYRTKHSIFHKLLPHKINWNDSGNSTERVIRSSFGFGETKQHPRNDYFERHLFRLATVTARLEKQTFNYFTHLTGNPRTR